MAQDLTTTAQAALRAAEVLLGKDLNRIVRREWTCSGRWRSINRTRSSRPRSPRVRARLRETLWMAVGSGSRVLIPSIPKSALIL